MSFYKQKRPVQHSLKFAIVGALGTVVNLVLLALLVEHSLTSPVTASVIATEISVIHNFLLNNFWTFGARRSGNSLFDRFFQFNLLAAGSILVNGAVVALLVQLDLWYLAAQAIGIACTWAINFFCANRLIFRDRNCPEEQLSANHSR